MTFAEALRAARPKIEDGTYIFICTAIYHTCPEAYRAQHMQRVMRMLKGTITYQDWCEKHRPKIFDVMHRTPGAFRQGRLQWIDDMIKMGEAK